MNDAPETDTAGPGSPAAKVWDLPLRLFHWLLVLTLIGSWATQELGTAWMEWHVRLGYFALTLVIFRLFWGAIGTRHARFAAFMAGPSATLAYIRSLLGGTPDKTAGHSPLAGWAVAAMLLSVAAQTISGLFQADDFLVEGPWHHAAPEWLRDLMHEIHEANFNLLVGLIALHLTALAVYRWVWKSDLIKGMVTGRRRVPASEGIDDHRLLAALVAAGLAAAIVWGIVAAAPEPDLEALFG